MYGSINSRHVLLVMLMAPCFGVGIFDVVEGATDKLERIGDHMSLGHLLPGLLS